MTTLTQLTALEQAQQDVDQLTALYQGLQDGTRFAWEWCDLYTCPDRTDRAIEDVYEALSQAQEEVAQLTRTGGTR